MFTWLKSLFRLPAPAGPVQELAFYTVADPTITKDGLSIDGDCWRIDFDQPRTVRLFEIPNPDIQQCYLSYRGQMRSEDLAGRAYLEMWCRLPARGEFFSKALTSAVEGTNDWVACEAPFFLKKGQNPDLIRLNIVAEGAGSIWLKGLGLLVTPLR